MNPRPLTVRHLTMLVPIAALGAALTAGCNSSTSPATVVSPPSGSGAGNTSRSLPSVHASSLPPLVQAAQKGDVDAATKLLQDKSTKVDAPDDYGRTALTYAAGDNDRSSGGPGGGKAPSGADPAALVKLLLSHHADPNAADQDGSTPLIEAVARHKPVSGPFDIAGSENARVQKVKLLLAAGVNVNACPKTETPDHLSAGETPLIAAAGAQDADSELIDMLLAKGANVNAKDAGGTTALMKAVRAGSANIVEILIAHHADVNARNGNGETALSLASRKKSRGALKCADLLTQAGAKP